MRTLISEGVYIDTYNLHADAGTEPGDLVARAANLQEVSDYINVWSVGNAVLVFGDTLRHVPASQSTHTVSCVRDPTALVHWPAAQTL